MQNNRFKTYYGLLGTTPDATVEEIEEAHRQARVLYSEGSVAAYSLYSHDERVEMLAKVEEAYATLSDTMKRRTYDAMLVSSQVGNKKAPAEGNIWQKNQGVQERFDGSGMERGVMLKEPLVVMNDRDQMAAEQYRILYTKVEHLSLNKSIKVFAITSAVKGEGKSVTSFNLAYVIAKEFGKKVVLVECDFRNPSITSQLLDMGEYGLVDVIEEQADLKDAIKRLEGSNLYLLPAGKKVNNAPEVIHSKRLSTIINTLKAEYDYVIIDSPPILPLADVNILTKIVDGLLLVVRAGKTPKDIVIKAVNSVSQDDILGIILNGTEPSLNRYYY